MATWMEKDVLIEFISHVVAVTARDVDVDNKDVISLLRLQGKLYRLSPEEIDYEKEVDFIKEKKAILESISCSDPKKLDVLFRAT